MKKREQGEWSWSKEKCHAGHEWVWEFTEGMPLGDKWPCGCSTKGATLVIWSSPGGCLRVDDEGMDVPKATGLSISDNTVYSVNSADCIFLDSNTTSNSIVGNVCYGIDIFKYILNINASRKM